MSGSWRWDDLKIVLAIAEERTLAGAARRLAVNHATAFRRLKAVESSFGTRLFERQSGTYTATAMGELMVDSARRVAAEASNIERKLAGRDQQLEGTLRITTTDTLLTGVLTNSLADFRRLHPAISLEVVVSNRTLNITRRDADIAIRPTNRPPDTLVGHRLGWIDMAVYGDIEGMAADSSNWVGVDARMGYPALDAWLSSQAGVIGYRVDSMLAMLTAVRSGIGKGVLPCYLAENDVGLVRKGKPIPTLRTELWMLTHPDLRRNARVMALFDFLRKRMQERGDFARLPAQ
ncbi:LysR family transcriptional regulator [Salinicola sp. LHM]|uniref:LysR family transcriptional regulator n=1 Tax=Salinicola TaxID=404432 RepID=UPI000DA24E68|nr:MULTISPECIES: LysR family transcriptional regulator [Salinicola]MEC8916941.1 LysR family transcriptional regulator [Pseudomonadota bacterium]WQH31845.1 LysR family transcriptional regulator [Salinicola sp. LHM]